MKQKPKIKDLDFSLPYCKELARMAHNQAIYWIGVRDEREICSKIRGEKKRSRECQQASNLASNWSTTAAYMDKLIEKVEYYLVRENGDILTEQQVAEILHKKAKRGDE